MAKQSSGVSRFNDYLTFMDNVGTVEAVDYVSPLDIKPIDLKKVDENQKNYINVEKYKDKLAQYSYDALVETEDTVLNLPADNPYQVTQLEQLKGDVGVNDKLFDINVDDLKNPYAIKGIESKAARLVSDPRFINVQREQALHKQFKNSVNTTVCAGKNANSVLCQMARAEQKKYFQDANGEYSATSLRAADFMPMDIMKELEDDLKRIPLNEFEAKLRKDKGVFILEEWQQRSKDAVRQILADRVQNPQFANNMAAMGKDTPEKVNAMINALADAWSAKSIKDATLRVEPASRGGGSGSGVGAGIGVSNNLILGFRDSIASSKLTDAQKLKANGLFSDQSFSAAAAWSDKYSQNESGTVRSLLNQMDVDGNIKDPTGKTINIKDELLNRTAKEGNIYALKDILNMDAKNLMQGLNDIVIKDDGRGGVAISNGGKSSYSIPIIEELDNMFSSDKNSMAVAINKYKQHLSTGGSDYALEQRPETQSYWETAKGFGLVGGNAPQQVQATTPTAKPSAKPAAKSESKTTTKPRLTLGNLNK